MGVSNWCLANRRMRRLRPCNDRHALEGFAVVRSLFRVSALPAGSVPVSGSHGGGHGRLWRRRYEAPSGELFEVETKRRDGLEFVAVWALADDAQLALPEVR